MRNRGVWVVAGAGALLVAAVAAYVVTERGRADARYAESFAEIHPAEPRSAPVLPGATDPR